MTAPGDPWLCLLIVLLVGFLLFLRLVFPNASRRAETAVLAVTIILFFSICSLLMRAQSGEDAPLKTNTDIRY